MKYHVIADHNNQTARCSFTAVLMQAASTPELCHMRSGRSSAGRWGNRSASAPVPHHQKVNVALIADQRTNPSPTAQCSVKPPVSASSFRAPGQKQLPPQQCASLPAGLNIFLACETWEISAGCERPQTQTSHSHRECTSNKNVGGTNSIMSIEMP
ncbi:uncharacterized protein ACIBXB_009969 [Morphnus guianensis]